MAKNLYKFTFFEEHTAAGKDEQEAYEIITGMRPRLLTMKNKVELVRKDVK